MPNTIVSLFWSSPSRDPAFRYCRAGAARCHHDGIDNRDQVRCHALRSRVASRHLNGALSCVYAIAFVKCNLALSAPETAATATDFDLIRCFKVILVVLTVGFLLGCFPFSL